MNKRIEALADKASNDINMVGYHNIPDEFKQKFAELIIKECANRASWAQDTDEEDIGGEVLKHFGVE